MTGPKATLTDGRVGIGAHAMGHPQVPKTVARPGAPVTILRVCDRALHYLRVLDPHTQTADTRQPRARGSLPAWRLGEMGPGGQ